MSHLKLRATTTVTGGGIGSADSGGKWDCLGAMNQKQVSEAPNPGNDLTYIARRLLRAVVIKTEGGDFSSLGMPDTSYRFTLNRMNLNDRLSNTSWRGALLLGQNQIQDATAVKQGYSGHFGMLLAAM